MLDAANDLFAERGYEEVSVEDIARAAGVTRGLVHHYFGGRTEVYIALLERLDAMREGSLRQPEGRSARARVTDTVSRWLDWTEANRLIYLGTIAPGEDIADPEVSRAVAKLRGRAVAAARVLPLRHRPGLAAAAVCAGVLDRAQPRRDTTVATRRRHPQRNTGAARLHARARPAHVRSADHGEQSDISTKAVAHAVSACRYAGPIQFPSASQCSATFFDGCTRGGSPGIFG